MYKKEQYLTEVNDEPKEKGISTLALKIYRQMCRNTFAEPGFSHIKFCYEIEAKRFREITIKLVEELSKVYFQERSSTLECITMGRYNQKETTKFHLDGGPDESYLILGYEVSKVRSELSLADYSLAAFELGISPKEFLNNYNPIFKNGEKLLEAYVTDLVYFDEAKTNLLFINNSSMAFGDKLTSLGVLHRAKIVEPFVDIPRIINSIQVGKSFSLTSDLHLNSFIDLEVIFRKPYE